MCGPFPFLGNITRYGQGRLSWHPSTLRAPPCRPEHGLSSPPRPASHSSRTFAVATAIPARSRAGTDGRVPCSGWAGTEARIRASADVRSDKHPSTKRAVPLFPGRLLFLERAGGRRRQTLESTVQSTSTGSGERLPSAGTVRSLWRLATRLTRDAVPTSRGGRGSPSTRSRRPP